MATGDTRIVGKPHSGLGMENNAHNDGCNNKNNTKAINDGPFVESPNGSLVNINTSIISKCDKNLKTKAAKKDEEVKGEEGTREISNKKENRSSFHSFDNSKNNNISTNSNSNSNSNIKSRSPVTLEYAMNLSDECRVITEVKYPYEVVYANKAFTKGTGYEFHEVAKQPWTFLSGPATNTTVLFKFLCDADATGFGSCSLISYTKKGQPFDSTINILPVIRRNLYRHRQAEGREQQIYKTTHLLWTIKKKDLIDNGIEKQSHNYSHCPFLGKHENDKRANAVTNGNYHTLVIPEIWDSMGTLQKSLESKIDLDTFNRQVVQLIDKKRKEELFEKNNNSPPLLNAVSVHRFEESQSGSRSSYADNDDAALPAAKRNCRSNCGNSYSTSINVSSSREASLRGSSTANRESNRLNNVDEGIMLPPRSSSCAQKT